MLTDDQLGELVYEELDSLVGLRGKPALIRMRKWPRAIPQYHVGYKEIQSLFDCVEKEYPGLYIAGNIRKGISVGDSVLCAHETVRKILDEKDH